MDQFLTYINESIAALEAEEKSLIADERKDEANLVKIRINIYGIARSFYEVVKKSATEESFIQEYETRVRKPAEAWKVSYEKAKEHNDVEKILIEEIKLQTLEAIIEKAKELQEA